VPENVELLYKTIALNHVPNVSVENVALGSESGTLIIHVAGSGSTSMVRHGINFKENIEVPVIALDDYIIKHKLEVGLIKVDVEGGEPAFLEGAKKTICEQKPILLLSIYHNAHDFFELKPLLESWDLGYTFRIYKPTHGSVTSETLLLAENVL
jgi:FkbM family methyltransferase